MSLYRFAVERPVAVLMITAAAAFLGYLASGQLGLELLPDLAHPTLTIRTSWPAAAPEEVEQEVTRRLESVVGTVEALQGMNSASRAGQSELILEFDWEADMDRAAQRVRERLGRMELPPGAEPPMLLRYDPSLEPVLSLAVSGAGSPAALRAYAEDVLGPEIARLEGVAGVRVLGGQAHEVQVLLTPAALAARGLSVQAVAQRLAAANVNVAGGTLREGAVEFLVRTVAELRDPRSLEQVVVGGEGTTLVRLGDVARVVSTIEEPRSLVRVDGRSAVRLDIDRQAGANLVAVCDQVRVLVFGNENQRKYTKNLDRARPPPGGEAGARHQQLTAFMAWQRPAGVEIDVVSDQSVFIRASLDEVRNAAWSGGLLAVVLLFLFLRSAWSTLVIAISIPLSILLTFVPLLLMGVTLNVMSLGGLALGIGMLVDNSIVVLESIYRCREEGDDVRAAAIRGTREVGGAVIASTLTTVAVFLPVVFVEGVAGQVFGDLSLAVVFSLLASLGVALLVVPMLASRTWTAPRVGTEAPWIPWTAYGEWRRRRPLGRILTMPWTALRVTLEALANAVLAVLGLVVVPLVVVARVVRFLSRRALALPLAAVGKGLDGLRWAQDQLLRASLRAPLVLLVGVGAVGWGATRLASDLGAELIPEVHQGVLTAELRFPVGTPLPETDVRTRVFADGLRQQAGVTRVDVFAGAPDVGAVEGRERGTHTAAVTVHLERAGAVAEAALAAAMRASLTRIPGSELEITRPALFSLRAPIRVEVIGHSLEALAEQSSAVEGALARVPGLRDVRSSVRPGHPELQLEYDRARLAALGLQPRQVAEGLRGQLEGEVATQLRQQAERVEVRVRLDPAGVQSRRDLEGLTINPGAPVPLPLTAVARLIPAEGPAAIHHVDGQRAALITARTVGLDLGSTSEAVRAALADVPPRAGQEVRLAGQDEEMQASLASLRFALLLAIFLVYVVMASQFENLRAPLVIMAALPLAAVGAVGALWLQDTPISVVVFVGFITLAGIVVNNAIVLVDYTGQLRQRGFGVEAALLAAGKARLRPILMTTLTTVLGLWPLAVGGGEGAELQRPLAITLIGGLSFATLLTLVVVPVLYRAVMGGRKPSGGI